MKLGGPEFAARETSLQTAGYTTGRIADTGNAETPRSGVSAEASLSDMVRIVAPDFKELALSLGLPQDKLTSSLLSFVKFFSLPLDPKLIQQLRQEVLSLKPAQVRSGAQAAAAAAAKGVVLSAEALAKYSAAIAGDEQDSGAYRGTEGDGGDAGTEPEDGASQGSGAGRDGQGGGRGETGFHSGTKHKNQDGLGPEQLRDRVEGIEGEAPLLGILNKLPGKDGRRWIVLPFSFNAEGVDFRVSLRILLADSNTVPWKAECIALNMTAGHDGIQNRWAFTLEDAALPAKLPAAIGSGAPVFARALVSVYPPPEHPAALEGKLQELLGTVAKKIILIEEV